MLIDCNPFTNELSHTQFYKSNDQNLEMCPARYKNTTLAFFVLQSLIKENTSQLFDSSAIRLNISKLEFSDQSSLKTKFLRYNLREQDEINQINIPGRIFI